MAMTREDMEMIVAVLKESGLVAKNDPASTTISATATHGPLQGNANQSGIFSYPGVRQQRFSTLVRPHSLARILTPRPTLFWQELLEVMSGVTAAGGTNASGFCGDPPSTPQGKIAQQVYKFGEFYGKTQLNAVPKIGQLRNRADLMGELLNAAPTDRNPWIPDIMYTTEINEQLAYEMFLFGVALERSWGKVLITGDNTKASNATQWGWISEPNGLDLQIKTGYVDVPSGYAVPAMDSAVINFNSDIGSTIGGGDGRNFVQALSDLVWAIWDRADEMGMEGIELTIVMRKEAFRAAVENWACNYATYRCSSSNAGQPFVNDVRDTNQLRLEMAEGRYLLIDNRPVPVTFAEGVPQDSLGGYLFKSDIYVVPLSWMGIPLANPEFFPMDNADLTNFASFVGDDFTVLNNGLFLAGYRSTGMCKEYHFAARMRLILETPWLAGRLDDVRYSFRAPIRNADPSDTWFYADGGISYRPN